MWFVAAVAALKTYWCMFEREGTSLVRVAPEAARFIRCERLRHSRAKTAMRIVAIHTGHCAFCYAVLEGLLKLRPCGDVTGSTLFIDGRRLSGN